MKALVAVVLTLALLPAPAPAPAVAAPAAADEIAALIGTLQGSQCRFQRNGRWYAAADAHRHLQRKYDYLRRRGLVDSAEQFIERGASRSSVSGVPYRVACPGQAEQAATQWFGQRLQALRQGAP